MNGMMVLVAAMSMGIDTGYQPVAGGGFEYMIQISAEELQALANGEDIINDVPANFRTMRRYRITYGNNQLPNQGAPLPSEERKLVPVDRNRRTLPGPGADPDEFPEETPDQHDATEPSDDTQEPPDTDETSGEEELTGNGAGGSTNSSQPGDPATPRRGTTGGGPGYSDSPYRDNRGNNSTNIGGQARNTNRTNSNITDNDEPSDDDSVGPGLNNQDDPDPEIAEKGEPKQPDPLPKNDQVIPAGLETELGGDSKTSNPKGKPDGSKTTESTGDSVHWTWWSITVLGLAASGAGNVYLGWMWWELRKRYRALVGSIDEVDA